jgi:phospholipid/cholesterol/gamma-HCH transport system ATP-binding protein
MIEIQHISKKFDDKIVLADISATFQPGICNLIIGASGSGKTVLTKCIVDLIKSDQGHIFFDGVELEGMSKEDRKELRNNILEIFMKLYHNQIKIGKSIENNNY